MGAHAEKAGSLAELEDAMARARTADRPFAVVIDTDPLPDRPTSAAHWWDVAVPEVSGRAEVRAPAPTTRPARAAAAGGLT